MQKLQVQEISAPAVISSFPVLWKEYLKVTNRVDNVVYQQWFQPASTKIVFPQRPQGQSTFSAKEGEFEINLESQA